MARFTPGVSEAVLLDIQGVNTNFWTTEHPNAPGIVHAMEGAKGTVYSLRAADQTRYALKVMKPKHKLPELASGCQAVEQFKTLSGMTVCNRYCITASNGKRTVQAFPQLEFAILMPWIAGQSWFDVVSAKARKPMSARQSVDLAAAFVLVAAGLEDAGVAHCDLSAGNIIIVGGTPPRVEFIDVEDIFAPTIPAPKYRSAGTPGYQHATSGGGQWGPDADRFAAAVLVVEMLSWCDAKLVRTAYGESLFDPTELQSPKSSRFKSVCASIELTLPGSGVLFERAWKSRAFSECPSLTEWRALLSGQRGAVVGSRTPSTPTPVAASHSPVPHAVRTGWDSIATMPKRGATAVHWGPQVDGAAGITAASGTVWEAISPGNAAAPAVATWTGSLPRGDAAVQPAQVAWQDALDHSGVPQPQRPTFVWENVWTPTKGGS